MMSLLKRLTGKEEEPTFKTRVRGFWKWYASVAGRYYAACENSQCPSLASEVSAKVDELIPGFAWVFGPGAEGKGHSFTLTGEGNLNLQFLTEYWLSQAPELNGWTFYSERQPSADPLSGGLKINEKKFDFVEFWLAANLNKEEEKIDISIWHPLFPVLPQGERWTAIFLMLDEVLGEYGTQNWVGEIVHSDKQMKEAMPIAELREYIQRIERDYGWEKYAPTEVWSSYSREPEAGYPRGDIFAGTGRNMKLLGKYWCERGEMEDPLPDTGADFVFIQFDRAMLPAGKEVDERGRFEDAAIEALAAENSGISIGGAMGEQYAYMDFLLFDGERSLDILSKSLLKAGLLKGSRIEFFAKEKRKLGRKL